LLDDFRGAVLDPEFRPRWGFLDARGWRLVLERAGFESVEIQPDIEEIAREYDAFSLAAIVARAPFTSCDLPPPSEMGAIDA
jgi:hypothetical protein